MNINKLQVVQNVHDFFSSNKKVFIESAKKTGIRVAGGAVALSATFILGLTLPILAVDCGIEFVKNKKDAFDKRKILDVEIINNEEEKDPTKIQIFSATLVNIIIMGGAVAVKGP
jgi:hypothetical protein